jgi:hypothetical protein
MARSKAEPAVRQPRQDMKSQAALAAKALVTDLRYCPVLQVADSQVAAVMELPDSLSALLLQEQTAAYRQELYCSAQAELVAARCLASVAPKVAGLTTAGLTTADCSAGPARAE